MNKKEKCKALMLKFFGPASAKMVELMTGSDEEIIRSCRTKTLGILGEEKAKEFDVI